MEASTQSSDELASASECEVDVARSNRGTTTKDVHDDNDSEDAESLDEEYL